MDNEFTPFIKEILKQYFGDQSEEIFRLSPLLQYINIKTKSAMQGSKSRGSFANIYAIYVLVEDYLKYGYDKNDLYRSYEGAIFTVLFTRQRELPFGSKLQNHALNHRLNEEFHKYFPQAQYIPILRDVENNRYWINENLLKVSIGTETYNFSRPIIDIIDKYIKIKRRAFESFINTCERLRSIDEKELSEIENFIFGLLAPNVDARIFEIVSYAILKYFYNEQTVYFGFNLDSLEEDHLILYKTGRTNANDGGIDFVMKPLGRFFQVTETLDIKKYFLDIDKLERYPISFVIKSEESTDILLQKLEDGARELYSVDTIVNKYVDCIEEIINIPILIERFRLTVERGNLPKILDEIILQSKVEFNYEDIKED